MTALVFGLRAQPSQRLDLSALTPDRLAGLTESDIAAIEVQTTRERVCVGDVFRLRMGDAAQLLFEGGSERFDRVGLAMTCGVIRVVGDVGLQAGRLMSGGRLDIAGNAGPWSASRMKGGVIAIGGAAGDRLGGPLPGETTGMRGGVVVVRGEAGARAADRLRRGTIIIEGRTGAHPGSRMIAGTLILGRRAGRLPGYLMARGSIIAAEGCEAVSPSFSDCGVHDFVATRLMADFIRPYSAGLADTMRRPWRRFLGDMAVIGKGEILMPAA
ncbi:MAG: formylmethanofuran dehydrogenase subunit C [Alphaproteobacteria bacterium]|nr:formylmethanofuran dehydrogenase subunit C [Alphaproteobacteria bacterium]